METAVSFQSGPNWLRAFLHMPDEPSSKARPAFLVLHGFGSSKDAPNSRETARFLASHGYAALRFDMRGCGESEGERGRIICLEQVEDTRAALTWLTQQPGIDTDRIGLIGSSFGAAVSLYTAGIDERVAAVISAGGWGNGERKFRYQHSAPGAYERFVLALDEGRRKKEMGEVAMMSRFDIVPIPHHLRAQIKDDAIMSFPVDTAQSMFDFRAEELVGAIAPRPLLLVHAARDSVTPSSESLELFRRAKAPVDLFLFDEADHFILADSTPRVQTAIAGWLQRYLPVGNVNG